jgi:hypothetical protein
MASVRLAHLRVTGEWSPWRNQPPCSDFRPLEPVTDRIVTDQIVTDQLVTDQLITDQLITQSPELAPVSNRPSS